MGYTQYFEVETPSYGGVNTAQQFSLVKREQSPRMDNGYMDQIGDLSKRPGSVPVITTALGNPIKHLCIYPFPQSVTVGIAPVLSAVAGAVTLPSATYYVRYTYVTDDGETEASLEASQAIVLGETLRVTVAAIPFHANSINIYISTSTNTEKLQRNTTSLVSDFTVPLVGTVAYPTANTTTFRGEVLASSGSSLYSYYNGALNAVTMTNALASSDIFDADFTGVDSGLVNVKVIADGGLLKFYDGVEVQDVTPATDDAGPAPANVLTDINAKGCKFVWEHSRHVFISPGTNEVFYSKRAGETGNGAQYNYFPETYYELLVRKGDYVNGCGLSFDNVMFVPMRQGWNIWTGTSFDDFDASEYLNTINGVIAPRSIDIMTYPNGQQTIVYLSDDGLHEVFTTILDNRGKQYATRNIIKENLNWSAFGYTQTEMSQGIGKYVTKYNMYLLELSRNSVPSVIGYDTRNGEFYIWNGLTINAFLEFENNVFFAGNDGLLKTFDQDLYSDWSSKIKTTGTPIHFKRYSPALSSEFSGFASMWDAYLLECKQWLVASSLDITFIFADTTDSMASAVLTEVFVEGVSRWGFARYANVNFTDLLNNPNEILFDYSYLSKYMQVLIENPRDEPVKLFKEKLKGRSSGR
jgi:hypothetical protein